VGVAIRVCPEEEIMKHLFEQWENIQDRIQTAQNLFLFLDYDGTLTPIVSKPELALCPPEAKALLEKLRDISNVYLAIISGRSLEDILEKIGISGITYVGNHGLDIQNPAGMHKKALSISRQREYSKILQGLKETLGEIPGILFEDKGSILAIHYRNVARKYFRRIHGALEEQLEEWKERWKITSGRMVFEIQPKLDFHKGKAVREMLKVFPPRAVLPIYLGDDRTDEDAFRAVGKSGITVFVGSSWADTEAEYYLNDPAEVEEFLRRCTEILRNEGRRLLLHIWPIVVA